jgi:hypothetical protein
MPTYEYRCGTCKRVHERVHSIKVQPTQKFPCTATAGCKGRATRLHGTGLAINTHPVTSRFPYVSSRLPFGIKGARHHGPLQKTIVENAQHKDRLHKQLGYVAA